ncbi:MAG: hypothetical protein IT455_22295, partial [Planctomycetes bacterium]|nr:hypothetical protein [Planctomycetota bacterium]
MTFKHKLSRRLAAMPIGLLVGVLALGACDAAPTEPNELITNADGSAVTALPANTAGGTRVIVLSRAKVYSYASLRAPLNASQWPGAIGTIVAGPTAVTSREPIALWRVDFTTHPDGWVRGDQIGILAP